MLACRTTQTLLRAPRRILAQPLACYSNKADIPKDNMFWMKHQIEAKPGFHSHINQERVIAAVSLGAVIGCVAFPGVFLLDQACAITFVAHGFYGIEAMIGDYVPLIAPVAVATLLQKLWLVFCIVMAAVFTNFNLKVGDECGVGHSLRALMAM